MTHAHSRSPFARASLLVALTLACSAVHADERAQAPQWWGDVNLASYHFGGTADFLAPGEHFNQANYGIGAELQWQPRHAVAVGYYRNSVNEDSYYALYHYTPLQLGRHVRVGGMVGAVTGYPGYNDGGIAPAAGVIGKVEWRRAGMNLIYLPRISGVTPHTLGLQFKVRFGQ